MAGAFAVPPGACDAHIHLYGPLDRYPLHPRPAYPVPEATPQEFVALQRAAGLSRAVVVHPAASGRDNRRTLDALREDPERYRGVIVPPDTEPDDAALAEWHRLGVRGIRFSYTGTAQPGMRIDTRLLARVAALGWHAQVHVEDEQVAELEPVLAALPVPVAIDHMARIPASLGVRSRPFASLLRLLDGGRTWVKLSAPMRLSGEPGPPWSDVGAMARALVAHAPHRLVWGSDWPHVNHAGPLADYGALVRMLGDWAPDAQVRRRILVDNACELYGFDPP